MNFAKASRTVLQNFIEHHFWKLASSNPPPPNISLLVQDADGAYWLDVYERAAGGWQGSWSSAKSDAIGEHPRNRVMYWARIMPLVP